MQILLDNAALSSQKLKQVQLQDNSPTTERTTYSTASNSTYQCPATVNCIVKTKCCAQSTSLTDHLSLSLHHQIVVRKCMCEETATYQNLSEFRDTTRISRAAICSFIEVVFKSSAYDILQCHISHCNTE